jgi:hypothetical protein
MTRAPPREVTPGKLAVALIVLVLHAAIVWLLLPHDSQPETRVADERAPERADTVASPEGVAASDATRRSMTSPAPSPLQATTPPTHLRWAEHSDPAIRSAYEEGFAFSEQARARGIALREREYGPAIGAAFRLPPAEAWALIEDLALSGDRLAADALVDLATQCQAEPSAPHRAAEAERIARIRGLSSELTAFQVGAVFRESEMQAAFAQTCRVAGLGVGRLGTLLGSTPTSTLSARETIREFADRYGKAPPTTPSAQLEARASAAFQRALDSDGAFTDEDWNALLDGVAHDRALLNVLSICLQNGCGGIPAAPPEKRDGFVLQAAQLGTESALSDLITRRESAGRIGDAYEWALYREWIERQQCTPIATSVYAVAANRQQAARLAGLLPGADRDAALVRHQATVAAHGEAALAFQGCTD